VIDLGVSQEQLPHATHEGIHNIVLDHFLYQNVVMDLYTVTLAHFMTNRSCAYYIKAGNDFHFF
jgi:hypothetical protein